MVEIGIIGCGNMGSAIASALCGSPAFRVTVFDSAPSVTSAFVRANPGARAADCVQALTASASFVVLAVKPQTLPSLYPVLRGCGSDSKKWISIAAGVDLDTLVRNLGTSEVVRFMPNISARVKSAVTAVAAAPGASEQTLRTALEIAGAFGSAFVLEEKLFSAFIGTSSSAIAYILQFLHALALGGEAQGIPYETAIRMAGDTMTGAVKLLQSSDKGAPELEKSVCSPGGTTIEGVKVLEDEHFNDTVIRAVAAAAQKAGIMEEAAKKA